MVELSCVLGVCLDAFVKSGSAVPIVGVFGGLSVLSLYFIAKSGSVRTKIRWSYPLVFGVLFIISYFSFTMMCHEATPFCSDHAVLYSIPAAIIGSLVFGYIVMPRIYLAWSRAVLSRSLAKLLPSEVPVYVADSGKPFAYSYGGFRKWIVISQGMVEVLTKKELQAVLLHEYGHLQGNSSLYKSTQWVYSKIPLLHAFLDGRKLEDEEEIRADAFAARTQGTAKYLNSAKRKLEGCFGC